MEKSDVKMTDMQFAGLGGGVLAYVKEIEAEAAARLLGGNTNIPPMARLFCLYNADGTPISVSDSREAAIGEAMQHDLIPASLH